MLCSAYVISGKTLNLVVYVSPPPFTCLGHMANPSLCSRGNLKLIPRTYKIALTTSLNPTFLLGSALAEVSETNLTLGILKEFFPRSELLQTCFGSHPYHFIIYLVSITRL